MTIPSLGPVVLGGNVFGWTVSETEAFSLLDAWFEKGGRAIDTADLYPSWAPGCRGGESEEIIGKWMAARQNRPYIVLCTKVGKWAGRPGLAAKNIAAAIDDSLSRLQTDWVDIYYAHQDDPKVEQIEYLAAFDAIVKAGRARAIGASNFTAARFSSALALSKKSGLAAFEISQDEWNLVARDIEHELVPLLEKESIMEVPFFALASGFLTGKYRPGRHVDSARSGGMNAYFEKPANIRLLDRLDELALKYQVSVAAISLAWLRVQPAVAAPIASARTIAQLDPLFELVELSPAEIEQLCAP